MQTLPSNPTHAEIVALTKASVARVSRLHAIAVDMPLRQLEVRISLRTVIRVWSEAGRVRTETRVLTMNPWMPFLLGLGLGLLVFYVYTYELRDRQAAQAAAVVGLMLALTCIGHGKAILIVRERLIGLVKHFWAA